MEASQTIQSALDRKFEKIKNASADFRLFVLIHDFIKYIEATPAFNVFLKEKSARAKEIPVKYPALRQIYQGIEDIDLSTNVDLGHDRYVAIRELSLIRKNELSENNSFWKRREAFKKITGEVHRILSAYLVETA